MVTDETREAFARRLNRALDSAGFPEKGAGRQTVLAKRINLSQKGVRKWLEGEGYPSTAKLVALSELLGVRFDWLVSGTEPMKDAEDSRNTKLVASTENVSPAPPLKANVPLVSWVQAGEWNTIVDEFEPGDADRLIQTTKNVGPHAFALRVDGDSMEPEFPHGSIIIVDPDKCANNGSFVVVRLDDQAEATFKQLVHDGGTRYLKPLNPRYPIIKVDDDATICGVVRQMLKDYD